jgi:hypothetical protein
VFYAKGILLANLNRPISGVLSRIRQLPLGRELKTRLHRSSYRMILTRINHLANLVKPPAGLGHPAAAALYRAGHGVAVKSEFELFISFIVHVVLLGLS